MNELIKVTETEQGSQAVSGRELYEFLCVESKYNDWITRMLSYGFEENIDYAAITQKKVTAQGNESVFADHVMKLDMAKEISMLTRNEKGKEARQYFIQCEKNWNSPEMIMGRALKIADQKMLEYREKNKQLETIIEKQTPKVRFADAVSVSKDCILIGSLAKILKQNGIDVGQNRLFEWMRDNGYLILKSVEYKGKTKYNNTPTQKAMDLGLYEIEESAVLSSSGKSKVYFTTKVTTKGQQYFINKFLNNGE